jgi:hypothetical protein
MTNRVWGDGGEWCNRCAINKAVSVGLCDVCRHTPYPTHCEEIVALREKVRLIDSQNAEMRLALRIAKPSTIHVYSGHVYSTDGELVEFVDGCARCRIEKILESPLTDKLIADLEMNRDPEWLRKMVALEDGESVSAGPRGEQPKYELCQASARVGRFGGVMVCNQPLPCKYGHVQTQ